LVQSEGKLLADEAILFDRKSAFKSILRLTRDLWVALRQPPARPGRVTSNQRRGIVQRDQQGC
jgi:hypothetical protein